MELNNVCFGYDKNEILTDISFKIKENAITTLIGANGCGKTTLLKLMTNVITPNSGNITLKGENIADITSKKLAKKIAVVHQKNTAPYDLTVKNLVSYGRLPYSSMFKYRNTADQKVKWALEAAGLNDISDRCMGTLSGGQRQRAFIAMALAQDTKMLFLDEPTTFLDIRYQIEILRLIEKLNRELGITVVMILHDINQAIAYSDEIIALKDGKLYAHGKPDDVITEKAVSDIYKISLHIGYVNNKKTVLTI